MIYQINQIILANGGDMNDTKYYNYCEETRIKSKDNGGNHGFWKKYEHNVANYGVFLLHPFMLG